MLIKGGGSAVSQTLESLPALLPTRFDKFNKKRMKQLEQMQANHAFGLTANQKQDIRQSIINPTLKSVTDLQSLTPISEGTSAADIMAQRQAGQLALGQSAAVARDLATQQVQAADQAKVASQRAELEARTKTLSDRRQEQLAAGLAIPLKVMGTAAKEYDQRLDVGLGAPNEVTTDTTAAQALIKQYVGDEEMLNYIFSLATGGM